MIPLGYWPVRPGVVDDTRFGHLLRRVGPAEKRHRRHHEQPLADGVSRGEQIVFQFIAIGATWGWAFVATSIILLAMKYTIGIRASREEEESGLDISQHSEAAYIA